MLRWRAWTQLKDAYMEKERCLARRSEYTGQSHSATLLLFIFVPCILS